MGKNKSEFITNKSEFITVSVTEKTRRKLKLLLIKLNLKTYDDGIVYLLNKE